MRDPCTLRQPCRFCGCTTGCREVRGRQNCIFCDKCGRHAYNAPKTETGDAPRTVETVRRRIKPGQQARMLGRDHGRCVLCGRRDQHLVIGHVLSIDEGRTLGATGDLLYDDANLITLCEACNLGQGKRSPSPGTYAAIV
jgi:5-methylcytosine-specific restriction endonuclease McrA